MKKQTVLVAAIGMALAACTAKPTMPDQGTMMETRNPANSSDSVSESANAVSAVSISTIQSSADGLRSVSLGVSDLTASGVRLSVKGVAISENVSTVVFDASGTAFDASKAGSSAVSNFVVSAGGKIIDSSVSAGKSSLNASKTALNVSCTIASEAFGTSKSVTIQVWNWSKSAVIGSVTVSGKLADSTSAAVKSGAQFVIDASGVLWTSSGQVIGQVWDGSKSTVSFVVEKSGQFLEFGSKTSVVIVTSTSKGASKFANSVWTGLKASKDLSVDVVKASAQGSVMIFRASGASLVAVSDAIGGVFQDKY